MLPSPRPAAPSHHSRPAGGMVISGYGSLSRRLLQSKLPYRLVHPTRNSSTSVSSIPNSLLDRRRHDDAPRLRHDVVSEKTRRGETRDAWHDTARGGEAGRTARGGGSRGLCARRCPTGPAGRAGGRARAPGAAGRASRARGMTGAGRGGGPAGPAAAPPRAGPWARSGAPGPRGTSGRAAPGGTPGERAGACGACPGTSRLVRTGPSEAVGRALAPSGRGRPSPARSTARAPASRRPATGPGRRRGCPGSRGARRRRARARHAGPRGVRGQRGGRPRRRVQRGRGPGPTRPTRRTAPALGVVGEGTPATADGLRGHARAPPALACRATTRRPRGRPCAASSAWRTPCTRGPRASWRASGGPAGEARPPPRLVPVGRADEGAGRRQGGHPVGPGGDGELRQHAVRPREGAAAPLVLLGG